MTDAQVLHAQSVTENTANSATWVDAATIPAASFTANKEYLLIAICAVKASSGTTDKGIRLVHGTTPTEFTDAVSHMDAVSSDERLTVMFLHRFTQPGTTEDVKVQFNLREGSGTIKHMVSTIIAIKLSDDFTENNDFYWNEATGDVADAATLTSRASVTFTPNGTDTWLILGQAAWNIANTGVNFAMCLDDNGTAYGDTTPKGYPSADTDDLYAIGYLVALTPSNASHTFAVQTQSAATQLVLSSRILALKLNKFAQFANVYTAASDAPSTGGAWETEATLSPTPSATGDWVILAAVIASAVAADNLFGRLQQDAAGGGLASDPAYGDDGPDNVGSSASRGMSYILATLKQLSSGASRAINYDFTQGGTGTVEARSLVAFSVALASTDVNGSASITLADLALSAAGTVDVQGAGSITLEDAALSAAGTVEIQGIGSITLEDAALSAAGTVGEPTIEGVADITLDNATLSAEGTVDVAGMAGITLADAALSAAGTVDIAGAAEITLADLALSAAGTVDVSGTADVTLADAVLSGTGTVDIAGATGITLADATLSAEGIVGNAPVEGVADITLADATFSAAGTVDIAGAANITLDDIGIAAAATIEVQATGSITLDDLAATGTGTVAIAGAAAIMLEDMTTIATAAVEVRGSATIVLADVTLTAIGIHGEETSRLFASATDAWVYGAAARDEIVQSAAVEDSAVYHVTSSEV